MGTVQTFKRQWLCLHQIFHLQPCESPPLYYTLCMLFFSLSFQSIKITHLQRPHHSYCLHSSELSVWPDDAFSHLPFISSLIQRCSQGSSSLTAHSTASISAGPCSPHGGHWPCTIIIPPPLQHWLLLPLSIPPSLKTERCQPFRIFQIDFPQFFPLKYLGEEGPWGNTNIHGPWVRCFACTVYTLSSTVPSFWRFSHKVTPCWIKLFLLKLRYIIHASTICKILWLAVVQRWITHYSLTQRILRARKRKSHICK